MGFLLGGVGEGGRWGPRGKCMRVSEGGKLGYFLTAEDGNPEEFAQFFGKLNIVMVFFFFQIKFFNNTATLDLFIFYCFTA